MVLVITALIALVVGLVLLTAGLMPRPIGTDPHCRSCGFSLRGHGDAPRPDLRCPECGKPITDAARITIGARRRRPALIRTGAVSTVLSLLLAGWMLFGMGPSIMPNFLLVLQATFSKFATRSVVGELSKRINADDVSISDQRRLVDAALKLQQAQPLPPGAAELLLDVLPAMTDEQCRRFVEQTLHPQLRTPALLRRNGTLLGICDGGGLSSHGDGGSLTSKVVATGIDCRLVEVRLGGRLLSRGTSGTDPYAQHGVMPVNLAALSNFGAYYRFEITPERADALPIPLGPTGLDETWELRARTPDGKRSLTWSVKRSHPITIVGEQADEFTPVNDAESQASLQKALSKVSLYRSPNGRGGLFLSFRGLFPQVDLSFRVIVRDATGKEVGKGYVEYDERMRNFGSEPSSRIEIAQDATGPVELEFVPTPPSNMNNVFGRVWTGAAITVKNVQLPVLPAAASNPTPAGPAKSGTAPQAAPR